MTTSNLLETIRNTVIDFCLDFVKNPYECYTEHGQHALFFTMLYNALPEEQRYYIFDDVKVSLIQKEYPTASKLGKPQRQHWDISIIKSPTESSQSGPGAYDYLKLFAAIEFGMNATEDHIMDDIERLCHTESNIENAFIVQLYRLSESGKLFSKRDWSSKSKQILMPKDILKHSRGKPVEIFYGLTVSTGNYNQGVWYIKGGNIEEIFITD